jgi:hypothetical protein
VKVSKILNKLLKWTMPQLASTVQSANGKTSLLSTAPHASYITVGTTGMSAVILAKIHSKGQDMQVLTSSNVPTIKTDLSVKRRACPAAPSVLNFSAFCIGSKISIHARACLLKKKLSKRKRHPSSGCLRKSVPRPRRDSNYQPRAKVGQLQSRGRYKRLY